MHITDLHIDRFGIWQDLTLPVAGPGLNVLYGPNEAGKSTLMRFVKAILYGGPPPRADADAPLFDDGPVVASGALRIEHGGESYLIRRQLTAAGGGHVHLTGSDERPLPTEQLDEMLGSTSETVFDRVFAVDLYELQELATLDHDELAEHVYGLSLGLRGRRLLAAVERLKSQRSAILSADGRSGRLVRLMDREAALIGQLRKLPDLPALRCDLHGERERFETEIASLKRRRNELRDELRGRRFLDHVHPAWRQVGEYTAELARRPRPTRLSAEGLAQLAAIDRERESLTRRQEERRRQAADAKRKLASGGAVPKIARAELAVRAMLGMRGWLEETIAVRDSAGQLRGHEAQSATAVRGKLGPEWTESRLAVVDTSPGAQLRLLNAARDYRIALGRRSVLRKRYRRLRQATTKREAALQERLEHLGKTPDAAAADLRKRLGSLERLVELRAKEAVLEQRGSALRQRLDRFAESVDVPGWVSFVLAIFAIGGAAFAILGLVTGVTTSAIAGMAYLLLGLTAGSVAARLRSHFETALTETAEQIRDDQRIEDVDLRKTRDEIARLAGDDSVESTRPRVLPISMARQTDSVSAADSMQQATKEFAELDELVNEQDRLRRRRKLLTALRARLPKVQQTVEGARQSWCEALVQIGLGESLDVEATLALWQRLVEARAACRGSAGDRLSLAETTVDSFAAQLADMARMIEVGETLSDRPLELLSLWERELPAAVRAKAERTSRIEEFRRARDEARKAARRLKALHRQQAQLLAGAGVSSVAEYERGLAADAQRRELEELLALAQLELESLAGAEPELAIVEDDLRAFDPRENADVLSRLAREQEEIEARLESAHERRGHLTRQLDELAADDRATSLRRQISRLNAGMQRMSSRLLSLTLAERAAEQARIAYERDHQPPVLTAASDSLARLTRNRYVRIWVPLGARTLRVDDDHGRTFTVEQLSGGTREQLFLALRLGLVRHAAERGVTLPLILDDVFVNFDQLRTEAAFETLRDFAEQGRQILFFTCHLHLAHLAESRGVAPIWLPGHQPPMQQRLAG